MNTTTVDYSKVGRCQSVSAVLWPSFLTAGLATVLFFTFFDPHDLAAATGMEDVTRMDAYSIGFFLFWVTTALSSLGTRYFLKPCESVNRKR